MPFGHTDRVGADSQSRHRPRPLPSIADAYNGLVGPLRARRREDAPRRNKGRWVWAVITALIIVSVSFAFVMSPSVQDQGTSYDPHGVIIIDGDATLHALALSEGWEGDGNETSPYVIEGYEIHAMGHDKGISVGNTSCHLVIEDCYVHDATFAGVHFNNVTNVSIVSTESANGLRCIEVLSSSFVRIIGNHCTLANEGIGIVGSDSITVEANNCSRNLVGIGARECDDLTVANNTATGNVISGIQVIDSRQFTITNNTCIGGQFGTYVSSCELGSVLGSTSANCSEAGLRLDSCFDCRVEGNRWSGNGVSGLSVVDSVGCDLLDNEAFGGHHGMTVLRCAEVDIRDNECTRNRGHGILLQDSVDCTAADNVCLDNAGDGMSLSGSQDCHVERNRCSDNSGAGIGADECEECAIGYNTCTNNSGEGVRFSLSTRCDIVGNDLSRALSEGLIASHCSDLNVTDNVCDGAGIGICLRMCDSCLADNNTVSDSVIGIALDDSTDITLRGNRMVDDGVFLEGSEPEHWNTHRISTDNLVNGLPVLYMVSAVGTMVRGAGGQVLLVECSDVTVEGSNLSSSTVGVEAAFSSGITVRDVSCSDGYIGVYAYASTALKVEDSDCSRNVRSGVELVMCEGAELLSDTCLDNIGCGVRMNASSGCSVTACAVSGSESGILSEHTLSAGLLSLNSVSDCAEGVRASSADHLEIDANEIVRCGYGVRLIDSSHMIMTGNTFTGCGLYIESDSVGCWDSHLVDASNCVNGRTLVYLAGAMAEDIPAGAGQVVLAGCGRITADSLDLSNATVGLQAGFSDQIWVMGCNLSSNIVGLELAECLDCQVLSSEARDCASGGIRLVGCSRTSVEGNHVGSSRVGIAVCQGLAPSADNIIAGNNASGNIDGIVVNTSAGSTVERNVLLSNLGCGLVLRASNDTLVRNNTCNGSGDAAMAISESDMCEVVNNTCSLNQRGIYLWDSDGCAVSGNVLFGNEEYGVRLDSASAANIVSANVFAYNNGSMVSLDGRAHAQARDDGPRNIWNSSGTPKGSGNYWHDWTSPDEDLDGLVDLPCNVSGAAGAKDYCPLAASPVPLPPLSDLIVLLLASTDVR